MTPYPRAGTLALWLQPFCSCFSSRAHWPSRRAEDAEGSGGGVSKGGMSAATAKRFKHERTLVMINPSLSGGVLFLAPFATCWDPIAFALLGMRLHAIACNLKIEAVFASKRSFLAGMHPRNSATSWHCVDAETQLAAPALHCVSSPAGRRPAGSSAFVSGR